MPSVYGRFQRATILGAMLLASWVAPAIGAEGATTVIGGTIFDATGTPVPSSRVVVRTAEGIEIFISPPSNAEGYYEVGVPTGGTYLIVALVAADGGRTLLPEVEPIEAAGPRARYDLHLPGSTWPQSARDGTLIGGAHRLFLSFVEDPAQVGRQRWEAQFDAARDNDVADLDTTRLVGAFKFWQLPSFEMGFRAAYGSISPPGVKSDSGMRDLDVWVKFLLHRAPDGSWELGLGGLLTLPTGDSDAGLGQDAIQAEWFAAASRIFPSFILVGHLGVVTSEDGEIGGTPLDSKVATSAGLGLLLPLIDEAGLVFEADYDGARFDETDSLSRLLAGLDWQFHWRSKLRVALATGLTDASPDIELIVGYATAF